MQSKANIYSQANPKSKHITYMETYRAAVILQQSKSISFLVIIHSQPDKWKKQCKSEYQYTKKEGSGQLKLRQGKDRWSQPAVAAILLSGRIAVPAIPGRSSSISFLTLQTPCKKKKILKLKRLSFSMQEKYIKLIPCKYSIPQLS